MSLETEKAELIRFYLPMFAAEEKAVRRFIEEATSATIADVEIWLRNLAKTQQHIVQEKDRLSRLYLQTVDGSEDAKLKLDAARSSADLERIEVELRRLWKLKLRQSLEVRLTVEKAGNQIRYRKTWKRKRWSSQYFDDDNPQNYAVALEEFHSWRKGESPEKIPRPRKKRHPLHLTAEVFFSGTVVVPIIKTFKRGMSHYEHVKVGETTEKQRWVRYRKMVKGKVFISSRFAGFDCEEFRAAATKEFQTWLAQQQ